MKRLHYAFFRVTSILCLAGLSVAFNLPIIAQQVSNPAGQSATPRPSISLTVTVTDKKGNPFEGLDKSAFTIFEDKVPQEITFFSAQDEPVSIGIIFDLSASMKPKQLKAARDAILRFIELSNDDNEYFAIAFVKRPSLLFGWTRGGKIAAEEFSQYEIAPVRGGTALYDACNLGIEMMKSGTHAKRAILLITDGQDSYSRHTFADIRDRLKQTGEVVYSIGFADEDNEGSSLSLEGRQIMKEFSSVSGGEAFFPGRTKEIDEVFNRIATELRNQYLLGFKPLSNKADGKWHKIKIKVTPPSKSNLQVRSREGYYALKNPR